MILTTLLGPVGVGATEIRGVLVGYDDQVLTIRLSRERTILVSWACVAICERDPRRAANGV